MKIKSNGIESIIRRAQILTMRATRWSAFDKISDDAYKRYIDIIGNAAKREIIRLVESAAREARTSVLEIIM